MEEREGGMERRDGRMEEWEGGMERRDGRMEGKAGLGPFFHHVSRFTFHFPSILESGF
jgi:hypothetical protein